MKQRKKYITVALGGTFDHFHDGHKAFIDAAAKVGQRLLIGIATQKLIHNKPFRHNLETLGTRFRSVNQYCKTQGYTAELVELDDVYGPLIDPDRKVDALYVTEETEAGANKITAIRDHLRLKRLPVYIVDMIPASDGQPIHAARIRAGEISRSGQVYADLFKTDIKLTEKQRQEFSKVQGKMILEPSTIPSQKIVVGDSTLEKFMTQGWNFDIGIFDGYCERELYLSTTLDAITPGSTVSNAAGTIESTAVRTLLTASQKRKKTFIKVNGEEDLLAVAAVLVSPLRSFIYYGQPQEGLIEVEATEKVKQHFANLLK